jgi:histidine triad (HIT) family protein
VSGGPTAGGGGAAGPGGDRTGATGCVFCGIARGEIPTSELFRDERFVAFRDLDPQAPVHALVVPVAHVASLDELRASDADLAGEAILRAARLARELGIAGGGYRLVWNCGRDGGQTVSHLHLHLLGGRPMRWPPG